MYARWRNRKGSRFEILSGERRRARRLQGIITRIAGAASSRASSSIRSASCAARPGNRGTRTHSHLCVYRSDSFRRSTKSRPSTSTRQTCVPIRTALPERRPSTSTRRTRRYASLTSRAASSSSARRSAPAQEPLQGDVPSESTPARVPAGRSNSPAGALAPVAGRQRRSIRAHPHLQLPQGRVTDHVSISRSTSWRRS